MGTEMFFSRRSPTADALNPTALIYVIRVPVITVVVDGQIGGRDCANVVADGDDNDKDETTSP